ncbi:type II toxin-antitoxin system RelE/ParE family toxin [Azospirillum sp. SYSU D00513]|uniref:type II toxin-antitoxin system RelE/ParE family toxin n=1 Tax=Azospirillum sp. SYSU D00513 TaxID=2812561 RepID=UPI001A966206
MIKTFADKRTAAIFSGIVTKGIPADVVRRAGAKLQQIDAATGLDFLRVPPANHLELLKGRRAGQHSIRVNGQWRICFRWADGDAYDVEFCDYH